jgi:hypothetical protein
MTSAYAEVTSSVFIKGKISSSFDEKKVKVVDSLGQTYFIARTAFPKDFAIREGATFQIEVDEEDVILETNSKEKKK